MLPHNGLKAEVCDARKEATQTADGPIKKAAQMRRFEFDFHRYYSFTNLMV